jgi:hypothetical protein
MEERKNEEASQAGDAVPIWSAPLLMPLDVADAQSGVLASHPPDGHGGCS